MPLSKLTSFSASALEAQLSFLWCNPTTHCSLRGTAPSGLLILVPLQHHGALSFDVIRADALVHNLTVQRCERVETSEIVKTGQRQLDTFWATLYSPSPPPGQPQLKMAVSPLVSATVQSAVLSATSNILAQAITAYRSEVRHDKVL